ncbi:pilus assembly protein PilZ [Methylobacterium sp. BTF04]|uniref:PilZ domain-containing protein n=1 Tax=Methylobacterium sp. BTF04 TaxID=2708300 RepID=UPI0013D1B04D|nr:PilZ domain-containing protein [Methylobacterium sp. BTF04]NEU13098.1 pilus assembly protein PilZ [Methylobacterium sp. BTF04]
MDANRRAARRTDAFRIGAITFENQATPIDCLVWDQSETGAQIELETVEGIPDQFTLEMTAYSRPRACTVVWRKERKLGVSFVK